MPMLPTTDWRERTEFLEKRSLYVFSIDLNLGIAADGNDERRLPFDHRVRAWSPVRRDVVVALAAARGEKVPDADDPGRGPVADTYHVLNDELTTSVDGAVHELPVAKVMDIQDWLRDVGAGVFRLDGRARLRTDDGAHISMLYGGVVRLGIPGGGALLAPDGKPEGSVHLATRYETDRPKYRWLSQAQLMGFGKARVLPVPGESRKVLNLSVDLYSML